MLSKIKAKQTQLLWGSVTVLGIIILFLLTLVINNQPPEEKKGPKKSITTGTSRINPQEVWVHKFTAEADLTHKRLEAIEGTLDKILKTAATPLGNQFNANGSVGDVSSLRQELSSSQSSLSSTNILPSLPTVKDCHTCEKPKEGEKAAYFRSNALQKISISLYQSRGSRLLKTTDNTIPAGAFAKVILLGGVDASTSIQSSSDPRPVLLRLISPGTLPRKFRSDLEDCHALAACYGDLSSERVFMRLEKLTCVERKTGEVLEMNVQGYVAGEDGRAGLRGRLVDRSTESLRNAMVGGFFSSIGNFLGQSNKPMIFSPTTGLTQTNPLTAQEVLKQSAGNGAGGALDKYAEFYIKRAEQLQPVIQVAAGRRADIVFTQGTDFTDSVLRQALSRTNDQRRFQQVQTVDESKSQSPWSPNGGGK